MPGSAMRNLSLSLRALTPGYDIFALRIEAEVEIEFAGARCRISREGDAGPRGAPGVTEHHRLNGHRRACVAADAIQSAIARRFRRIPRAEHGRGGGDELFTRIAGKGFLGLGTIAIQHLRGQNAEITMIEFAFGFHARLFQRIGCQHIEGRRRKTRHNFRITLDEAPIAVPGEPGVTRHSNQSRDGFRIQPDIEDRFHHSRHRNRRA